ncbi:hypothetical protein B0H63DRAFT_454820 [Podospora didyma]|uniref:Ankyrin n=1 Tax=Podospora didyma TaxID=330526 RepID=A0AAE0K6B9_9PEZI|nr:hypothetical protein B0H63DRAFT_454820 [Podospora didyma]
MDSLLDSPPDSPSSWASTPDSPSSQGSLPVPQYLLHLPLHEAATHDGDDKLRSVLAENPELIQDINQPSSIGATPLWIACFKGNWAGLEYLVSLGANINHDLANGFTPVFHAVFWLSLVDGGEAVARLAALGADLGITFFDAPRWYTRQYLGANYPGRADQDGALVPQGCKPLEMVFRLLSTKKPDPDCPDWKPWAVEELSDSFIELVSSVMQPCTPQLATWTRGDFIALSLFERHSGPVCSTLLHWPKKDNETPFAKDEAGSPRSPGYRHQVLKTLFRLGANPLVEDNWGNNLLQLALAEWDFESFRAIAKHHPDAAKVLGGENKGLAVEWFMGMFIENTAEAKQDTMAMSDHKHCQCHKPLCQECFGSGEVVSPSELVEAAVYLARRHSSYMPFPSTVDFERVRLAVIPSPGWQRFCVEGLKAFFCAGLTTPWELACDPLLGHLMRAALQQCSSSQLFRMEELPDFIMGLRLPEGFFAKRIMGKTLFNTAMDARFMNLVLMKRYHYTSREEEEERIAEGKVNMLPFEMLEKGADPTSLEHVDCGAMPVVKLTLGLIGGGEEIEGSLITRQIRKLLSAVVEHGAVVHAEEPQPGTPEAELGWEAFNPIIYIIRNQPTREQEALPEQPTLSERLGDKLHSLRQAFQDHLPFPGPVDKPGDSEEEGDVPASSPEQSPRLPDTEPFVFGFSYGPRGGSGGRPYWAGYETVDVSSPIQHILQSWPLPRRHPMQAAYLREALSAPCIKVLSGLLYSGSNQNQFIDGTAPAMSWYLRKGRAESMAAYDNIVKARARGYPTESFVQCVKVLLRTSGIEPDLALKDVYGFTAVDYLRELLADEEGDRWGFFRDEFVRWFFKYGLFVKKEDGRIILGRGRIWNSEGNMVVLREAPSLGGTGMGIDVTPTHKLCPRSGLSVFHTKL